MTPEREALKIARGYVADDVKRNPSDYDPRPDLDKIDTAIASLSAAPGEPCAWNEVVADALDCFWNAAIGSAQQSQDATATAISGSLAEGFSAIATRLREHAVVASSPTTPQPAARWTCLARKQSLPEPGECNWPDCGCDPHATKVIESLVEQGWTAPREAPAPAIPHGPAVKTPDFDSGNDGSSPSEVATARPDTAEARLRAEDGGSDV